ncbi:MAG: four helix bundle protein [Candidatus Acidiferrales bacterium]
MRVQSYRDLTVWQKAMELVTESYRLAKLLPKNESFGLISQIQRSAISIPANIAEGHGREHLGDYLHHLSIANGSLLELETHLPIAERLGYFTRNQVAKTMERASEVGQMLAGLKRRLNNLGPRRQPADT